MEFWQGGAAARGEVWSSVGAAVLFHVARSFRRDTHGMVREEGDTAWPSGSTESTLAVSGVTDAAVRPPHIQSVLIPWWRWCLSAFSTVSISFLLLKSRKEVTVDS